MRRAICCPEWPYWLRPSVPGGVRTLSEVGAQTGAQASRVETEVPLVIVRRSIAPQLDPRYANRQQAHHLELHDGDCADLSQRQPTAAYAGWVTSAVAVIV